MSEAVVVTGVGCLAARAPTAAALAAPPPAAPGATLPTPLPRPAAWACRPPRLGRMDRFSQVAFLAAHEALVSAEVATRPPRGEAFGIVLGTAYGCHAVNEEYYRGYLRDGARAASPRLFAYTLPSSPVGELAIHFAARGPILTLAQGWDAGLQAVAEGARLCARGRADLVVAGGAEILSPTLLALLADWGYDLDAAEGAAFLVLERAAAAAARGVRPLARVGGAGAAFAPSLGRDTAGDRAARAALVAADLAPSAITAVWAAAAPPRRPPPARAGAAAPPWPPPRDIAARCGVTFGAGGALAAARTVLDFGADPGAGPTLCQAADPLGGAAALILAPPR